MEPSHLAKVTEISTEDLRQSVYASMLWFSPEAGSLRERMLDRLVCVGLVGSSDRSAYRVSQIQTALRTSDSAPTIRDDLVNEALARLVERGVVRHQMVRQKHSYWLDAESQQKTRESLQDSSKLIRKVLDDLTSGLSPAVIAPTVADRVLRKFIGECMARFGREMARSASGAAPPVLAELASSRAAVSAALAHENLAVDAVSSISNRCLEFLRRNGPDYAQLKFALAQGYYFSELLGLKGAKFNPLTENAFAGAVFYLDTNVVLLRALEGARGSFLSEVATVAKRVGISLRVTRATINEARGVAVDRRHRLEAVVNSIPSELLDKSKDQFISAFLRRRAADSTLSVDSFLSEFDFLADLLAAEGVALDEFVVLDVDLENCRREAKVINDLAEQSRGFRKSAAVLNHDVAHVVLVERLRSENPKTWFLTRDHTLGEASVVLAGEKGLPACYEFAAFAQSVSPFLTTDGEVRSLAELFSRALEDHLQLAPVGPVFDLRELALIAEMHDDVLKTPKDQLLSAFDYVKQAVLKGRPYTVEQHRAVALGLKKFLASSSGEERRALAEETQRLQLEVDLRHTENATERHLRLKAEAAVLLAEDELRRLRGEVAAGEAQANELALRLRRLEDRDHLGWQWLRAIVGLFGLLVALAFAFGWRPNVVQVWMARLPVALSDAVVSIVLRAVSATLFAVPLGLLIRNARWRGEFRMAASVALAAAAVALAGVSAGHLSYFESAVSAAAPIVIVFLLRPEKRPEK